MSAGHFHVHGPHDHAVEHAARSADPFAGRIALMTAIFATIGALFGHMAGATQNDALMFKDEATIRKTDASDQWNFYAAKSGKQNLAELGATLATGEAQAMMTIQIGIALAAITILTRNKVTGYGALGVGGAAIVLGASAFAHA